MTAAPGQIQPHATPVPIAPDPLSLSSDWKATSEASIRRTQTRKTRPSTPSSGFMRQRMASNTSVRTLRPTHSPHYVHICVGKTAIRTTSMRSRSTTQLCEPSRISGLAARKSWAIGTRYMGPWVSNRCRATIKHVERPCGKSMSIS